MSQSIKPKNVPLLSLRSIDCSFKDNQRYLVGAIDDNNATTTWSNHGDCIDFYAFGDMVITPGPAGFLNISSGTSLSSPIAVRFLSQNVSRQSSAAAITRYLSKQLDETSKLTTPGLTSELSYRKIHAERGDLETSSDHKFRQWLEHRAHFTQPFAGISWINLQKSHLSMGGGR